MNTYVTPLQCAFATQVMYLLCLIALPVSATRRLPPPAARPQHLPAPSGWRGTQPGAVCHPGGHAAASYSDSVVLLLTTLLGAVRALLEPGALPAHVSSQPVSKEAAAGGASNNDTVAATAGTNSSTSSQGTSSSEGGMQASASSTSSSGVASPGVLEAVGSLAVTAAKVLVLFGINQACNLGINGEAMMLGAQLNSALLQLALQQLPPYKHPTGAGAAAHSQGQQQQQPGIRKATLQLMEGAQRLLYHNMIAAEDAADRQRAEGMSAPPWTAHKKTTAAAAVAGTRARERQESTRSLFVHLSTSLLRLHALSHAAAGAMAAPSKCQGTCAAVSASAAGAAAAAPGAADVNRAPPVPCVPASGLQGAAGCGCPAAAGEGHPWCPAHSSSPAPSVLEDALQRSEEQLVVLIAGMLSRRTGMQVPGLLGCGHAGCGSLACPSEAGAVTNRRGVVCSGCGVVQYCGHACAQQAWPVHRRVCRRLAAAGARGPDSNSNSGSDLEDATRPSAAAARAASSSRAMAGANGACAAMGASSSSRGSRLDTDQNPPSPVCAWCGKASQNLLRCGRCKAAWYCGVDHQRAAWKAGHKQECGAAARAAGAANN
jgi:hypothetical protein